MTSSDPPTSHFLVEWYQHDPATVSAGVAAHLTHTAATSTADTEPVALLMMLTVPHDHTVFGVFTAASADAVIDTCQRAGWPADRISSDVHPWLTPQPS